MPGGFLGRRVGLTDGFEMRQQPDTGVDGKFSPPQDTGFDDGGIIPVAEWVATGRTPMFKKVCVSSGPPRPEG